MKTRSLLAVAALLGLLALLIAAGPAAQGASAANACEEWGDRQSDEIRTGQARKAVLCLVNRERSKRGLKPLSRDKKLQSAAQIHNDYMQKKKCFSHQCPGEASLTGRLQTSNWLTRGLSGYAYGENIAWGSGHLGTPANIMKQWMNSSGHRANILSKKFAQIGVGYTKGTISSPNAVGAIITTTFGWKKG